MSSPTYITSIFLSILYQSLIVDMTKNDQWHEMWSLNLNLKIIWLCGSRRQQGNPPSFKNYSGKISHFLLVNTLQMFCLYKLQMFIDVYL